MKQNAIAKFKEIFNIKSKITYKKLLNVIDSLILSGYDNYITYSLEIQEDSVYINYIYDYQDSDIDWGKYNFEEDFYVNPYTQETWCRPLNKAVEYSDYQSYGKGKTHIEAIIDLFLDIYYNSNNQKYHLIDIINDILT